MALSDDDVREILRIIDESHLQELHIETDGFSLHVRRDGGRRAESSRTPRASTEDDETASTGAGVGEDAPPAPTHAEPDGMLTIPSPMLGTFYRAEAPGDKPFVNVGSAVEPDTTVCIIEVMKMMNSVPAGTSGTIVEVCPGNAELVEYGQPLFRVQPR
jgi:acetyl-CoA carboxylase biotin carboxyl carrier protein